jgi:hypothetical protein
MFLLCFTDRSPEAYVPLVDRDSPCLGLRLTCRQIILIIWLSNLSDNELEVKVERDLDSMYFIDFLKNPHLIHIITYTLLDKGIRYRQLT